VSFSVSTVSWQDAAEALAAIRRSVFIQEQGVPEELEWDGLDAGAIHILASDQRGQVIGCARMLPEGRIGRMAVLQGWRRQNVGSAMLKALIAVARARNLAEVSLSAQMHAIPFYAVYGFQLCSDVYDDAGIPHRDMRLPLSA
jgi:predicted GNAT family N-acyltransferase